MSGNKNISRLKAGEKIYLFRKDGLLPITCGLLKYFDEKHDKVCINVDNRSVVCCIISAFIRFCRRFCLERFRTKGFINAGVSATHAIFWNDKA